MELVTLLEIHVDSAKIVISLLFSSYLPLSLPWTLVVLQLNSGKALQSEETAAVVKRFSVLFLLRVISKLQDGTINISHG